MLPILLLGCDHDASAFTPKVTDAPAIYDIGELRIVPREDWALGSFDAAAEAARAAAGEPAGVHYGQLGASADVGIYGGATFQFIGTGGPVCVVLDPESVFWAQSVEVELGASSEGYLYQDRYEDDADVDLSVGLTAYYTGSPGVAMGDFKVPYTDAAGVDHTLEANECVQASYWGDMVHAGRASVEYCTIDTDQRAGVSFTGVLDTFSLPIDDSIANFAVAVLDGECGAVASDEQVEMNECLLPWEPMLGVSDEGDCSDADAPATFNCLEQSFCKSSTARLNEYCAAHLDDEDPYCIDNGKVPRVEE